MRKNRKIIPDATICDTILSQGPEDTLSIELAMHCETADVDGSDEFGRLWDGIMHRVAPVFFERLGISIETEIRT